MPRDLFSEFPEAHGGTTQPRDLFADLEPVQPEGPSFLSEAADGLKRTVGYGLLSATERFWKTLDDASTIVSKATGLPKGGVFKTLADNVAPSPDWQPQNLAEEILAGLYGAPIDIAKIYAAGGPLGPTAGMAALGAVQGGAEGGLKGATVGGIRGGLMGGILKAVGYLKPLLRVPTMGGVFGSQAAMEGGGPRDVIREAAIGAGLALPGAGGARKEPLPMRRPLGVEPAEVPIAREEGIRPVEVRKEPRDLFAESQVPLEGPGLAGVEVDPRFSEAMAAASSTVMGRPKTSAATPSLSGTQEPLAQVSKMIEPSEPLRALETPPSKSEYLGKGLSAIVEPPTQPKYVRPGRNSQELSSVPDLLGKAEADRAGIEKDLQKISDEIGGLKVEARVKVPARIEEKIEQKRIEEPGFGPEHILDYLGTRITDDPLRKTDAIIKGMEGSGYKVLSTDDLIANPTELGYRAVHLDVKSPTGLVFEVQLHFPQGEALTNQTWKFYEKWRSVKTKNQGKIPAELVAEHEAEGTQLRQKWADAEAEYRESIKGPEKTYPIKPNAGQSLTEWIEGDLSPQGDLAHLGTSTVFRELDRASTPDVVSVLDWSSQPDRSPWVKRFIASEAAAALRKRGLTPEKKGAETHEQRIGRLSERQPKDLFAEPPKAREPIAIPAKGQATSIIHSEGKDQATYALVESDQVIPSHDMKAGFAKAFGGEGPAGKKIRDFQGKLEGLFGEERPPAPSVGMAVRPIGRAITKPVAQGPPAAAAAPPRGPTLAPPPTPRGVAEARGISRETGWARDLATRALEFVRTAPRTYRAMPKESMKKVPVWRNGVLEEADKSVSFRGTIDQLRQNRSDYEVAQHNAVRLFRGITREIPSEDLSFFYDAVVASDMAHEAGRRTIDEMPFGMTKAEAQAWKAEVDRAVQGKPEVAKALETRKQAYKTIVDELIDSGIMKEEQLFELDADGKRVRMKNEDYFHHQVLQYANFEAGPLGKGKSVTKPKPGYAKRRGLKSTSDYNTDVFEADIMHLTRALYDIRRARRFEGLMKEHDISAQLKRTAKQAGIKDWHELVPKGYEAKQYDPGRTFFQAKTVPERLIEEIMQGPGAEVLPADLRKLLAVGSKHKEYVIPTELADTFTSMTKGYDYGPMRKAARTLTTAWKKSVLLLPRRFIRYNWQNQVGDLDAALAGAPGMVLKAKGSAKDLYSFYHGTNAPRDVQDAFERAVLSSTLTFEEIPSVRDLHLFDNLPETRGKTGVFSRYMRQAGKWTTYRENVMRLAAYRYYLEKFEKGDYSNIGASIRKDVMALKDVKDRAAKVGREIIGDYGAISELGREMRDVSLPFYSWMEVNLSRYKQLIENSFTESKLAGTATGARLGGIIGRKAASKFIGAWAKMLFLTGAVHTFNQLTASESESTLDDYDRRRLHLNLTGFYRMLGGSPDKTVIMRGQSALGDLLEWVGINDVIASFDDFKRGLYTGKDAAKDILKSPVNKLIQAINPFYKALFESISGVRIFPDVFKPGFTKGTLATRLPQTLADMFTVGEEWKLLTHYMPGLEPVPMRNYAKNWTEAVVTARDQDEQAYSYIMDRKYRFMEKAGKGGAAASNSEISIAYYNLKRAIRYEDKESEAYWRQKVTDLKGSKRKAREGIESSMDWADPLAGLSKGRGPGTKWEFMHKYLDPKERELLQKAENFYRKTYR